ncbi:MAG: hypothetical protein K1X81_02055 [Bacteroidia bacterium]|nr:hypothetical protein [Bacteroidia bacterium]
MHAYYLPNADGVIDEVFVYQGDVFIGTCQRINQYNEAKAEWVSGQDDVAYKEQAAYVGRFDAKVKEGKQNLAKLTLINPEVVNEAAQQTATVVEEQEKQEESLEDLLNNYSADEYARKSTEDL